MIGEVVIHFDGGYTPKVGGYGSYEVNGGSELYIKTLRERYGHPCTSNIAEYRALLSALHWLKKFSQAHTATLRIFTDSKLVQGQVRKQQPWKCKASHLVVLRSQVHSLLAQYPQWEIKWERRLINVAKFGH